MPFAAVVVDVDSQLVIRNHTSVTWIDSLAFAECEVLVVRTLHVAAFLGVSFCCFSSCLTFLGRLLFPRQDQLHHPCRSGLYLSSWRLGIDSASQ